MTGPYRDRTEAGQALAGRLAAFVGRADVVVLALPRGGVPVGYEIARALRVPLDVLNVRKLGVPWQPELAMGAVATGGVVVRNDAVIAGGGIPEAELEDAIDRARRELERREMAYREGRPAPAIAGTVVVLVDDGIATGSTMRAAIAALRQQAPARIVVAVPIAPPAVVHEMSRLADECICLRQIDPLYAIGMWYMHFPQVSDDEVRELLRRAAIGEVPPAPSAPAASSAVALP